MNKISLKQNLDDLANAIERLQEALDTPLDAHDLILDGTIQRFEFCIELLWKNFKNLAELEGKEVLSPRQALMQAYQMKWIDKEQLWLSMLSDRNLTSHTYKKVLAHEIYNRITTYFPEMQKASQKIATLIAKHNSR